MGGAAAGGVGGAGSARGGEVGAGVYPLSTPMSAQLLFMQQQLLLMQQGGKVGVCVRAFVFVCMDTCIHHLHIHIKESVSLSLSRARVFGRMLHVSSAFALRGQRFEVIYPFPHS